MKTLLPMPTWIASRPRLMIFFLIGVGGYWYFMLPQSDYLKVTTRALMAWNIGATLFIFAALHMIMVFHPSDVHATLRPRILFIP